MEKPEVLLETESVSGIKVSFESGGKKFVNFVVNADTIPILKTQGIDVESIARNALKRNISQVTDSYIQHKLSEIDEDLPDLVSEKSWLEGVFASKSISPEQVRNETVLVILGKKTIDQAITDLSIPDDLVSDFKRAIEIARIIAWKEAIWKAESQLESQIDSMSLEQLLSLDVKKLCEDTYSKIPLEV